MPDYSKQGIFSSDRPHLYRDSPFDGHGGSYGIIAYRVLEIHYIIGRIKNQQNANSNGKQNIKEELCKQTNR